MKALGLVFVLLLAVARVGGAADTPSKELVQEYIEQSQIQEIVKIQADEYVRQLTVRSSPEEKTWIREYMEATMGWDATKDEYVSLTQKIFTASELRAALAFMRTPEGASMLEKQKQFTRELTAVIAQNVLGFTKQPPAPGCPDCNTDQDPGAKLTVLDPQKQSVNGRVYFTGRVENYGKQPVSGAMVEVHLFLKGKFVDQYTAYISGKVVPGEPRYFKVSGGYKNSPPAEHDEFRIQVFEGFQPGWKL